MIKILHHHSILLLLCAFMMTCLDAIDTTTTSTTTTTGSVFIHPNVHRALRQQGTVNLMITMKNGNRQVLEDLDVSNSILISRGERIQALVSQLEKHAQNSQASILNRISISNSTQENEEELYQSIQTFWISNQMYIQGATVNVIEKIMHLNEIQEIREEIRIPFVAPIVEEEEEEEKKQKEKVTTSNTSTIEWGVERVHAPVAWNAGFHGQDIIVANIDTGVLLSHESLKNNFVGEYGWFDPEKKEPLPYDPQGHGTHTMGTMVGQNGIGVAPGAKWMACKGCRSEQGCVESDLLACAEFMTCPTDPQGNNRKCDKAPHVINNSWGGGQGETFFLQAVNAWIRAGIVPVFSNGNTGPKCQTANSPADLSIVISVGAIDQDDHLGSFSSKGPTIKNLIKPDISAPGVRVRSSINAGDNRYSFLSSTSMAAPHVSGVIALILNAKPTLSYDQLRALLYTSVEQSILKPSGLKCGNITDGIFPNNDFGYGLINVAKALDTLKINN